MGWRSGFRRKLFGNLRIYTVSGKKRSPHYTGGINIIGLFTGIERKRQTSELYSHSQFSHMLFTDVENK